MLFFFYFETCTYRTNRTGPFTTQFIMSDTTTSKNNKIKFWTVNALSERYEKWDKLGQGSFGKVYRGKMHGGTREVAIKKYWHTGWLGSRTWVYYDTIREIHYLTLLSDHPNIMSVLEFVLNVEKQHVYLVMPLYTSTLYDVIRNDTQTQQAFVNSVAQQIASALAYCHRFNIMHRDVKANNVLVSKDGHVVLSDFGSARHGKVVATPMTNPIVTVWQRPPEILMGERYYGMSCDVWSFGVMLLFMVVGKHVWSESRPMHQLQVIYRTLGTPTKKHAPHLYKCGKKWMPSAVDELFKWPPPIDAAKALLGKEHYHQCPRFYRDVLVSCLSLDSTERPTMASVHKRFDTNK